MIDFLIDVFPSQKQTIGLFSVFLASLVMSFIGRSISSEFVWGGSTLLMGWGVGSLVYTAVATLSMANLSYVVWALFVFSLGGIIFLKRRGARLVTVKPWRILVLGFPFLLIVSAKYPSEVDVLSHWLYNVIYLLDHGVLPRPGLPQSLSAYTGFPYNHTFALHFVSVLAGAMAESAGNVINFGLVILFAMLLANLIQLAKTDEVNKCPARIGWPLAALALILATYANPIFVRKIVLMANPDTATSVGLAFLGITAWQLTERLRTNDAPIKPLVVQFSLISLFFINLKQPNIIILFLLCIGMALLLSGKGTYPRFQRFLRLAPILIGPALLSYILWRTFVSSGAQLHEATLLPFEQWQFQNIPAILSSFWANAVKKAGYFGIMTVLAVLAGVKLFRPTKTSFDRLAILAAVIFIGWNGVLFFLYIAHWTGHASTGASSYWRYNTFIGYFGYAVVIYGLSRFFFQNYLKTTFSKSLVRSTALPRIIVTLAILMPIVTTPYLRFDRQQPKPYLRSIGNEIGASVPFGSRVLVHIPGDIGDYATVMQYFANRFRSDISVAPAPSLSIIKSDLNKEYPSPPMVWSMCSSGELEQYFALKLPENQSFLLTQRNGNWAIVKSWDWPKSRFLSSYHKNIKNLKCDISY